MLGSNPSADSVASTDPGGMLWHPPFHLPVEALIGRGSKALNPGCRAKPLPPSAPHAGRPLIMRDSPLLVPAENESSKRLLVFHLLKH